MDGHPSPMEHFVFLKIIFDHAFKESTVQAVEQAQNKWVQCLQDASADKKSFRIFDMDQTWLESFYNGTIIKTGHNFDHRISTLNGIS